jgi:hypothetical protein
MGQEHAGHAFAPVFERGKITNVMFLAHISPWDEEGR